MVSFTKISKQYGRQVLFVDASFQLNPGEKVGLVGPNGSGKTTLFRMIVGEEAPDEGDVSVPKKLSIGYFKQDVEEMSGRSVLDETIAGSGRAGTLHHELEELNHAMGDPARADDMDKILARFGEVQEEYEHLGGYALEAQAREVLHGLGFEDDRIDGDVGNLSGGWKMRVAMARVLLGRPDVLLMDEPTNHLDIESIIWLEEFLKTLPGALLMTSHDREFMNRIVTRIAEIDGGEITAYSGNYDFYERERAIRETNREAAYARQQAMFAKEQRFIERFAAHAAKAAQVQSRVKALEKIEKVELPKKRRVVKFDFRTPPRSGDQVATLEGVTKRYGKRTVHDGVNLNIRRGERWCVMGKNGAGKSTLLKMIAGATEPDAGSVTLGASLKMGYFAQQSLDVLDPDLTIEEQLQKDFPPSRSARCKSLAGAFQFSGEDTDKRIRMLSGGEKTRLVHGADAAESAEFPGARRADQPSRSRHQGNADRRAARLRRDDGVRVARPRVPARPEQPRPRAGRRKRHRGAAPRLSRQLCRIRSAHRPRGAGRAQVTFAEEKIRDGSNGPGRYRGGGRRPSRPRRRRSKSPDPLRPGRSPDHPVAPAAGGRAGQGRRPGSPPSTTSSSPIAWPRAASPSSTASWTTPARPTRRRTTITATASRLPTSTATACPTSTSSARWAATSCGGISAAAASRTSPRRPAWRSPGKVSVSASFADIDNDGDEDLYVTTVRGGNMLFENDGKGHFKDISAASGLNYTGHSSAAVFFDYDHDGKLDLFLVNVGRYTTNTIGGDGYASTTWRSRTPSPDTCTRSAPKPASSTTTTATTTSWTSRSRWGCTICRGRATPAWSTSTTTAGPISTC